MVPRLADTSFDARRRRPVGGKKFAQRTACRIDELFETEHGDAVRHAPPARIIVEGNPGERRLEHVHVRVGTLRHSSGAIFHEAAERMAVGSLQRGTQRHCLTPPAGGLSECTMPARVSQQGERLVVKIEAWVLDSVVETHDRDDGAIRSDEMFAEIFECMRRRCAPRPAPTETTGFAV